MHSYISNLLILIPALPLLAAAVVAVFGKRVLREQSHWPVVLALAGSCAASVLLVFAVQRAQQDGPHEHLVKLWTWATVDAPVLSTQYPVHQPPTVKRNRKHRPTRPPSAWTSSSAPIH